MVDETTLQEGPNATADNGGVGVGDGGDGTTTATTTKIGSGQEEQSPEKKDAETATDGTSDSIAGGEGGDKSGEGKTTSTPIVSSSKKSRPPYKYDPNKITLRFLFANRDGLTVTIECNPSDTVGEVKGALISVWPEDMPQCDGGESLRLICMGKGYLMPDTRTLEDCQIPVFKTHPTPINVSVKPDLNALDDNKKKGSGGAGGSGSGGAGSGDGSGGNNNESSTDLAASTAQASQGCNCVIL